jgi:signal peptidase II
VAAVEATTARDPSMRAVLILLGTAIPIYVADQATKLAVVANLALGERVEIVGDVVMLWHARNTGGAFSILQGQLWLFVPVTILALGMVAYFHRSLRAQTAWIHVVLGMVLGGTLGNLTDRLRLGYVVDFVSVGIGDVRFPTFNVADPAVVIGIGLLVVYLTFFDPGRQAS